LVGCWSSLLATRVLRPLEGQPPVRSTAGQERSKNASRKRCGPSAWPGAGADPNRCGRRSGQGALTGQKTGERPGPEAGQGVEIRSFRAAHGAPWRSKGPSALADHLQPGSDAPTQKRAGLAALLHQGPAGHLRSAIEPEFSPRGFSGAVWVVSEQMATAPLTSPPQPHRASLNPRFFLAEHNCFRLPPGAREQSGFEGGAVEPPSWLVKHWPPVPPGEPIAEGSASASPQQAPGGDAPEQESSATAGQSRSQATRENETGVSAIKRESKRAWLEVAIKK